MKLGELSPGDLAPGHQPAAVHIDDARHHHRRRLGRGPGVRRPGRIERHHQPDQRAWAPTCSRSTPEPLHRGFTRGPPAPRRPSPWTMRRPSASSLASRRSRPKSRLAEFVVTATRTRRPRSSGTTQDYTTVRAYSSGRASSSPTRRWSRRSGSRLSARRPPTTWASTRLRSAARSRSAACRSR